MTILNILTSQTGLVGVLPNIAYINTDDTVAEVTTTGYLNKEVANGFQFFLPSIAVVSTKETPTSQVKVGWYEVQHVGQNWSLDAGSSSGIELTNGHIFVGNASNVATDVAMSGDITISNTGVTAISAGVIVNADISASAAIAYSKLAALPSADILVGSAGNVATAVAMTGDVTISNAGVTAISSGVIVNADINASAAIDFSKLAALNSARILVGSAGNVATSVALSGDATISNTGALTIANAAINSNKTALSFLQYFSATLTSAEFKAMYDTPKLLVSAGGVNTLLVLDQFQLVMTFGSAAYASGGVVAVQYDATVHGGGVSASMTVAAAEITDAVASSTFTFVADADTAKPFATSVNKGLYLSNPTGAFTTGDSAFVYHIWYRQIAVV